MYSNFTPEFVNILNNYQILRNRTPPQSKAICFKAIRKQVFLFKKESEVDFVRQGIKKFKSDSQNNQKTSENNYLGSKVAKTEVINVLRNKSALKENPFDRIIQKQGKRNNLAFKSAHQIDTESGKLIRIYW